LPHRAEKSKWDKPVAGCPGRHLKKRTVKKRLEPFLGGVEADFKSIRWGMKEAYVGARLERLRELAGFGFPVWKKPQSGGSPRRAGGKGCVKASDDISVNQGQKTGPRTWGRRTGPNSVNVFRVRWRLQGGGGKGQRD